jgi:hypothetical protein
MHEFGTALCNEVREGQSTSILSYTRQMEPLAS